MSGKIYRIATSVALVGLVLHCVLEIEYFQPS